MSITRLPQELLLIVALLGACFLGFKFWEHRIREDEAQKVELRMNEAWVKKLKKAEDKALLELIQLRGQHAEDYNRLRSRAAALAGELQKRPTRAQLEAAQQAAVAAGTACPVCTGAGLAREDGEFLAGEASAAAGLQHDLFQARGAYDTCRRTLEAVTTTEGK
jgi:ABC-type multidrug transport system fused ATPase/permease subunit